MKANKFATGKEAEANGQPELATELYEKELSKGYNDLVPYERLLVLYRRQKKYRQELQVLSKGIKLLEDQLSDRQKEVFAKNRQRTKLLRLSRTLAQKLGLLNRKGDHVLLPQPLEKWVNRKKTVQKKIKAHVKKRVR
jgi:tetratricopeptide (TPR) repeat protein